MKRGTVLTPVLPYQLRPPTAGAGLAPRLQKPPTAGAGLALRLQKPPTVGPGRALRLQKPPTVGPGRALRYNNARRMKDLSSDTAPISDRYEPAAVEERWYPVWETNGYFRPELPSKKKPFSIVIPPPNVTGSLHMGHALDNTLQDVMVRMKRMERFNTLWVPGTDHAGIATQVVVERQLAAEGKTKDEVGREEFLRRVWRWKEESGGT